MNLKNLIRHLIDIIFMMSIIWIGIGLSLKMSYLVGYRVDDWSLMNGEMISLVASIISGVIAGTLAALFVQFYHIRYGIVKFLAAFGMEVYLHIPLPYTITAVYYGRPLVPDPSGDFPSWAMGTGVLVFVLVWSFGHKLVRLEAEKDTEVNRYFIVGHMIDMLFIVSIVFLGFNPPVFVGSHIHEFTADCSLFGGENYCFIESISVAIPIGVFSASFVHFYRIQYGLIKISAALALMLFSGLGFLWHCSEEEYTFMVFVASMLIFMLLWFLFSDHFTVLVKVAVGIISVWAMWWYVQYTCDANQEAMYQYQLKRIEKDKAMRKKNEKPWEKDARYRF